MDTKATYESDLFQHSETSGKQVGGLNPQRKIKMNKNPIRKSDDQCVE